MFTSCRIFIYFVLLTGAAAIAVAEPTEYDCSFVIRSPDGNPEVVAARDLRVLEMSKSEEELSFETADGTVFSAIVCKRSSIVPADNDYKVVDAGLSLYLQVDDLERPQITILDKADGAYRLRLAQGDWSSELERKEAASQIERFNGNDL